MCNLYTLKTDWAALEAALRMLLEADTVFPEGVSAAGMNRPIPQTVYPKYDGLFLKAAGEPAAGLAGGLAPAIGRWGLVPAFHKGGPGAWKAATNNARSETMATSPAFRDAFRRRRCLIPATHIIEWTGPKGSKTKHAISRADGQMLFLAGLWDRCRLAAPEGGDAGGAAAGEWAENYTMVMMDTAPGDDMHPFHNRQPVLLDRAGAAAWLDLEGDVGAVLRAPPPGTLVADPREPVGG
ncbi:MAG: SOS response-associated peptidase family protein [Proteobacteria bacterium]|nr:SOS response-associated peptidase family protein [Pseudomonadota bacterium]